MKRQYTRVARIPGMRFTITGTTDRRAMYIAFGR